MGTGPNGLDMGSQVAQWASISGEPPANTAQTTATLTVGGPASSRTSTKSMAEPGAPRRRSPRRFRSPDLANGAYTVYVVGKNDASVWQADAAGHGLENLDRRHGRRRTWCSTRSWPANQSAVDLHGTRPDAIELYNGGTSPIDLSDMSLTDNPLLPRKFVFPAGSTIAAGGYFVVYADTLPSAPGELHTGFALSGTGGESVRALQQIGRRRLADRQRRVWRAGHRLVDWPRRAEPAVGAYAADVRRRQRRRPHRQSGDAQNQRVVHHRRVVIQGNAKTNDFVELYNPDTLPVPLGGLYLSDDPVGEPGKSQIPPLSFIGAGGVHPYSVFQADSQPAQGADHANFKLASDRGWLVLSDSALQPIDRVLYGPQTDGYSQGARPTAAHAISSSPSLRRASI